MFWESVQQALKTLTYWQIYAAGLQYLIIIYIPMLIAFFAGSKRGKTGYMQEASIILVPFFQAIATLFFVFSSAQIALGFLDNSTWRMPVDVALQSPLEFLKLAFFLVLAAILLALLPVVGRISSLQTLVLGGLALVMMLGIIDSDDNVIIYDQLDYIPGFWFIIGIVVVGAIVSGIGVAVVSVVPEILSRITGRDLQGIGTLIILPIASTLGFVPFFIYAAWVGEQVVR